MGPRQEAFRRLCQTAEYQQGLFTSAQAEAAGFSRSSHAYHVRVGNWVREHRGIYRLTILPRAEQANFALWGLWSSNRDGEPEGVYSHETALSLHHCWNRKSAKLNMTVPTRFRRNSGIPAPLTLHYADLPDKDISAAQGYKFTAPLRTILDLIAAGTLPKTALREALLEIIRRGLITHKELNRARIPSGSRKQFEALLSAHLAESEA